MICFGEIKRWDGRGRLIVDGYTCPGMDLAELLEYVVLPYHKDIPKPRGLDIFTEGLARIIAEPSHMGNQSIRLVAETGNDTLEPKYYGQKESIVV